LLRTLLTAGRSRGARRRARQGARAGCRGLSRTAHTSSGGATFQFGASASVEDRSATWNNCARSCGRRVATYPPHRRPTLSPSGRSTRRRIGRRVDVSYAGLPREAVPHCRLVLHVACSAWSSSLGGSGCLKAAPAGRGARFRSLLGSAHHPRSRRWPAVAARPTRLRPCRACAGPSSSRVADSGAPAPAGRGPRA